MQMAVLNCGFDKIEAVFPTARCDIMVTDLASAKVLESNSKAIRGVRKREYPCEQKMLQRQTHCRHRSTSKHQHGH